MGFLIGRCRELLVRHKVPSQKSYAVFVIPVIPTVLPTGYEGIGWRRLHDKKTVSFLYHEEERIYLSVQDRGWPDQAN